MCESGLLKFACDIFTGVFDFSRFECWREKFESKAQQMDMVLLNKCKWQLWKLA